MPAFQLLALLLTACRAPAPGPAALAEGPQVAAPADRSFGRYVAITHDEVLVIDLDEGRVVGTLPGLPLAVRADGAALLSDQPGRRVEAGPLRWWAPPGK